MAGKRVLIVDDDQKTVELVKLYLNRDGYRVLTAYDGSEALHQAQDGHPDLIVLDLMLPGMDGLELFDELRKMRPDIPVIIITAYGSPEAADEALKKGVADFITKPFRKDTILFTMKRVLELAMLKKENLELKRRLDDRGR